jgi:hypothetical protein
MFYDINCFGSLQLKPKPAIQDENDGGFSHQIAYGHRLTAIIFIRL